MAGRIREEDVQAVRERTDFAKVVSQFLTLKRTGADSMTGLCPFHTEKSPSFSISPSKGLYHCFGCGASGDAIGFLRQLEGLSFTEAVERLARDANVTLRYEGDSPEARAAASRRQSLHDANERAFALYHEVLVGDPAAEAARAYLGTRGIDKATAEAFGIGFAPPAADFLRRRLQPAGIGAETLVEAGLAFRDQASGAVRDRFRGRITFPVRDLQGRAIGIGARVLPGGRDDGPKYLNSPETTIYRKGETLYNLDRAKGAVSRSGEIVVVEGYTDVIALAQAGIETAVATCGTALGEGHFRLASRFAQRMILAFDSDEAGARAAERAYAHLEAFPISPMVLVLPEGMDPADFVRARGADAFRELAAAARPVVDYMIRRAVARIDRGTVEGQTAAVAAAAPLVRGLRDPVRRSEYAHLVADLTGVAESAVRAALDQRGAARTADLRADVRRSAAHERVEREMLRLLARDAAIWLQVAPQLTEDHFQGAGNAERFRALATVRGDVAAFVAAGSDAEMGAALTALTIEPMDGEPSPAYAEDVRARLEELVLKRRAADLRRRMAEVGGDETAREQLFQDLLENDRRQRGLRPGAGGAGPGQ